MMLFEEVHRERLVNRPLHPEGRVRIIITGIEQPDDDGAAILAQLHGAQDQVAFARVDAEERPRQRRRPFCPACDHNSAERMFEDSLRKIKVKMSSTVIVREAIESASGKDAVAVAARSMLESCLSDGVVAFQKHCEALYAKLPAVRPAPLNVFQRLRDGGYACQVSPQSRGAQALSPLERLNSVNVWP